jgi:hypothetical protein
MSLIFGLITSEYAAFDGGEKEIVAPDLDFGKQTFVDELHDFGNRIVVDSGIVEYDKRSRYGSVEEIMEIERSGVPSLFL